MDQSADATTLDGLITRLQGGLPVDDRDVDGVAGRLVRLAAAVRAPYRMRDPARSLARQPEPAPRAWRLGMPRPQLLAPVVAAILVIVAAWPRLGTTDAAELVVRADDAASGAAPLAASSYTGAVTVHVRLPEVSPFSSGASGLSQITETIHFAAPASIRVDVPGAASLISNGREAWLVDPRAATAQRLDSAKLNAANPLSFAEPPSFLRALARGFDVTLVGTARIAERDAQEVVLHPRVGSSAAGMVREVRLFIDKALALQLKGEARADGGEILVAWEFTNFAVNVVQDPALFAYVPGPGVRVIESNAAGGSVTPGWKTVATRAPFSAFATGYLPRGIQDGPPSYDSATETIVRAYRAGDREAFLLLERAAPAAHPLLPGGEVNVGGVRGFLESRDGRTYLRFDREGTRIELSAADGSSIGADELLRVAASLRAVQR
jgi:hypothetical protein